MFRQSFSGLLLAAILSLPASQGTAQSFLSLDDVAKVTVLPGWRTATGNHMAAIRIELAEGWKTYWRSAGESGIPPRFNWSGSGNLKSVQVHWPTPEVFNPDASRSYGYFDVVVIPIELTPSQSTDGVISIRGQMNIGVCEDICVPMSVDLTADLPNSGAPDTAIQASLANRPTPAAKAGLRSVTCSIEPISDGLKFSAKFDLPSQGGSEVVVFELPDKSIWIDEAQSSRSGRQLTASTDFVPPEGGPFALARSDVRMTVFGSNGAVDIQGCAAG